MSTEVRYLVPASILEQMINHAQAELPNESCGILCGIHESERLCRISAWHPTGNALASPINYEIDPRDLIRVTRLSRDRGEEIVGFCHSHPTSSPIPSRTDQERNAWGESVVHFIVSLAGDRPEVRAWHIGEDRYYPAQWTTIEDTTAAIPDPQP